MSDEMKLISTEVLRKLFNFITSCEPTDRGAILLGEIVSTIMKPSINVSNLLNLRDALVDSMERQGGIPMTDALADALVLAGVDIYGKREVEPSMPELTEEPFVVEAFADNGAHSQWVLIDRSTGKTLWEEASHTAPAPEMVTVPKSEWDELRAFARVSGYPEAYFSFEIPFERDTCDWGVDITYRMGIGYAEVAAWLATPPTKDGGAA